MSNYSNYTNNQNKNKNNSAASTSNAKNCPMKGKLSSLNSLIKVFAVTLVILALQYSNKNHYGVNGKGVVNGLESSNVRNLSEVNSNYGGSRENLHYSGENVNDRRNQYNSGNVNSQWGSHENIEPSTYHGTYNNPAPQETGEQNTGELNLNCFNSGLCQKLKKNAVYIVPGMIAGYYAWNTLGTQTFLLVAAIIGVLLFANHNSH